MPTRRCSYAAAHLFVRSPRHNSASFEHAYIKQKITESTALDKGSIKIKDAGTTYKKKFALARRRLTKVRDGAKDSVFRTSLLAFI